MRTPLDRSQTIFLSSVIVIFTRIFPIIFGFGYLAQNTLSQQIIQPNNLQALSGAQYYQSPQMLQNDNMQANLKILLRYLNDEASKQSIKPSKFGNSIASPNAQLQRPANFPSAVKPHFANQSWQNKPLIAPLQNSQTYTTKVRRMAPNSAFPQNLMNFLQNDASNAYNNGMVSGQNMDWVNSAADRNDDNVFGNNNKELPEDNEKEDSSNGNPLKFSKLAKPTQPNEASRALLSSKAVSEAKANGYINENNSPNTNANNNNASKPVSKTSLPASKFPTTPPPSKPPTSSTAVFGSPSDGTGPQRSGGKLNSGMTGGGNGGGQVIGVGLITPTNNKSNQKQVNGGNSKIPGNSPLTQQQIVPSILLPQTGNPTEQIPSPNASPQSQVKIGSNSVTNSSKHNFKLIYFDARGICEPIRLLFHYSKVPFEDSRITRRQWLALKDSTVYGKVPILEVDGKPLTYCHTISRFLARTFGLAGVSSWEQAKVDEISDFHSDVAMDLQPYLYVVAGFHQGDREALRKAIFLPGVEKHFPVYVNLLKQSGSGYFVQSGLTWIDFVISEYMTTIKHFEPAILDKYPALTKFVRKVQSLPQIFDYIANREHQPVK